MTYHARAADQPPRWRRGTLAAATVASLTLHLLALLVVVAPVVPPEAAPLRLSVRMKQPMLVAPPLAESGRAPPAAIARGAAPRKKNAPTAAVLNEVKAQPRASTSTFSPTVETTVVEAPPATPAAFAAAPFVADHLHNPQPVYPAISRRLGEEGRVVLSVRVSALGSVLAVAIDQSSGFARLDDAARLGVERWRFVPARLGSEAVASSVLVPLRFSLGD